jgi:hypothetical protein
MRLDWLDAEDPVANHNINKEISIERSGRRVVGALSLGLGLPRRTLR